MPAIGSLQLIAGSCRLLINPSLWSGQCYIFVIFITHQLMCVCVLVAPCIAGHEPAADSSSSTCFDGQPRPQPTCASPPRRNKVAAAHSTSERSSRPAKSPRGLLARLQRLQFWPFDTLSWQQRKQVHEAGQLAFAMLVTSGVALGVIAGLQLFMQGKQRGRGRVLGRS